MRFALSLFLANALFAPTAAGERAEIVDDPMPAVRFVEPHPGQVLPSPKVLLRVEFEDYDFIPGFAPARSPNAGHYIIYLTQPGSAEVKHFAMPRTEAVRATLEPGSWCAYVELLHHDHTRRLAARPTDLPPFDKVCFRVEPPAWEEPPAPEISRYEGSLGPSDDLHREATQLQVRSLSQAGAPGFESASELEPARTERGGLRLTKSRVIRVLPPPHPNSRRKITIGEPWDDGTYWSDGTGWVD